MMLMSWIQPNHAQVKVLLFIMSAASNSISVKNIAGYVYQGFPLRNYGNFHNIYSQVTVDECQYLCEISDLCQYFNYVTETDMDVGEDEDEDMVTLYKACYLKFGVGKRTEKANGAFGYKYSTGEERHF